MRPRSIVAAIATAAALWLASPEVQAGPPCITNVAFVLASGYASQVAVTFTINDTGCSVTQVSSTMWRIAGLGVDHANNCSSGSHLKVKIEFNNHSARCDMPAINTIGAMIWNKASDDPPVNYVYSCNMPATAYSAEWNFFEDADAPGCAQDEIDGCMLWSSGCTGGGS